ncbi:MAG: oligosaccharide flippase family protein [Patescibacteria group bacterium]
MLSKTKKRVNDFLTQLQESTGIDMHYIARGGGWSLFSFVINSSLSLITAVLFANLLPKETYGTYKYLLAIVGSIGFLTLTGMNTAVVQAVSRGQEGALQFSVKLQLKWNLLLTIAAVGIGLYYLIKGNLIFAYSIFILSVFSPLNATLNTYGAFLAGKKEFRKINLYGIAATVFFVGLMAVVLILTENIIALITTYSLATLLPKLIFYRKTLKIFRPKKIPEEEKKKLISYSGHLSLVNVFSIISQYIDKIAVFQFLGPVQLAVYSFALVMPDRIKGFLKNASAILISKLVEKEIKEIRKVFYKRVLQGLAVGATISLVYILFAPIIFGLFFPKYLESIIYSQVLSLSLVTLIPAIYMGSVFRSHKMIRIIYLSSAVPHIARIILFLTLGKIWGVWGIIWAALLISVVGPFYNFLLWGIEMRKLEKSG